MPPPAAAAAILILLALLFIAAEPRSAQAHQEATSSIDHAEQRRLLIGGVDDWQALTGAFVSASQSPTAPLSAGVAGACALAESAAAASATDPRQWLVGSDDVGVTPCRIQVMSDASTTLTPDYILMY